MIYNYIKKYLLLLLISLTSACATIQSPTYHVVNWESRQNQLYAIKTWQLKGAIAIKTTDQAFSASLYWQQNDNDYNIHMFGPLGIGTILIHGKPNYITLQTNKQFIRAKNPEQLLQQELGWHLPISSLYYWIRSIPEPHTPSIKRFDSFNRLIYLKQQGWEIRFFYSTHIKGIQLPKRLLLNNGSLYIRIAFSMQPT